MNQKKFSIIIPMKNVENYILEALESIKTQTFKDFEVFVINDHSEDKSVEKVEEFIKDNPNMDIKLFHVEDGKFGPGAGRNVRITKS